MELCLRATACHLPYGISVACHLSQVDTPALTPTRWMEG